MLRIGILGMGGMGWVHASRYFQLPGAEVVAIADIVPERLEAKERVSLNIAGDNRSFDMSGVARFVDSSRLVIEADLDMVDVCLPTYLHARYVIEALEAGHHVLCEKPIALEVAEATRMIETAKKANRLLMVAQCVRFWPEYQFLRRCVNEARFGRLLSVNMWRTGGRPIWSWENWILDVERSGGTIYDLHIHDVDYVNSVFGAPDTIQAIARKAGATGSYDIIHASYTYQGGPQVHIHAGCSVAQIPFNAGYVAWFERGIVSYDPKNEQALQVFDDPEQVGGRPAEYEKGDAYLNEISYFVKCVENGEPPTECTPESVRESLELVRKEIVSIENTQTVSGKDEAR